MPRHTYELTSQTIKVVNGHAGDLAEEMHVNDKHVYAILAGTYTDPFAVFDLWYASCVRAGLDVSHYDNRLAMHREKAKMRSGELNIDAANASFTKEASDVPASRLSKESLYKQLEEVQQANAKGAILERALLHAIANEGNVREFAKEAVGRRA